MSPDERLFRLLFKFSSGPDQDIIHIPCHYLFCIREGYLEVSLAILDPVLPPHDDNTPLEDDQRGHSAGNLATALLHRDLM